jgi:transcriptional regulator with PAS, ATPase and Fis domain
MERVKKVFDFNELKRENIILQERLLDSTSPVPDAFSKIITQNKNMLSIFRYCEAIAKSRQSVLVTGETGAGKELFAQALHQLSGCQGSFIPVNIAGFDDNLLSDTLFGHKKGAFTGAMENREGMIEKASGGTLFLDEIGDLNISSQVKLLRLLQEREYSPLGSDLPKRSDARVILATHQDLRELQKDSKFRKDLYYRISTHHIHIPPLRERKDDIKLLLDHFILQAASEMNKKLPVYHGELVNLLSTYYFPGNIRELQSMVFDAVSNHTSKMLSMNIFKSHIDLNSSNIQNITKITNSDSEEKTIWTSSLDTLPTLKQACYSLVEESLKRANGNQSIAARMLGISPQAFSARLKNHGCDE